MPRYLPTQVMPAGVTGAVDALPYWFVIGGQAVRCFCPYRPSLDVDFGVGAPSDAEDLLRQLSRKGEVEVLERSKDTIHLSFDGIDVSIFVLRSLTPHTEARALTVTGLLATKLHAIIDRGTRRDFFDLYVLLQDQKLGIAECLRALRIVYGGEINEGLVLRAMTYFEDADREPRLPGEGERDFARVKAYFEAQAGALLLPPTEALQIAAHTVDVRSATPSRARPAKKKAGKKR